MSKLTTVINGRTIRDTNGNEIKFVAGEYNDLPAKWLEPLEAAGAFETEDDAKDRARAENRAQNEKRKVEAAAAVADHDAKRGLASIPPAVDLPDDPFVNLPPDPED